MVEHLDAEESAGLDRLLGESRVLGGRRRVARGMVVDKDDVRRAGDGSGNNSVSYSYDVFGAIRSQSGTSSNYWLFTGEQRDSDSSLYYLRARHYDPAIGRFLMRDPLAGSSRRPGTLNRYAYVTNNPASLIDPYGLFGFSDITDTVSDVTDTVSNAVEYTEHAAAKTASAAASAATATGEFLERFGTLNCLSFAINAAAVTATLLAPELTPELALSLQLLNAGILMGDKVAFAATTIINFSQVDNKEGVSVNNILDLSGVATSGASTLAGTLNIMSSEGIIPFASLALGVSAVQCVNSAF